MPELAKKNLPASMAKSTLPEVLTLKLPKDGKSIAVMPVALLSRDSDGDGTLLFGDRLLNTTPWGTDSDGNDADTGEVWKPFNKEVDLGTGSTLDNLVPAETGKKIELMILGIEAHNLVDSISLIEITGTLQNGSGGATEGTNISKEVILTISYIYDTTNNYFGGNISQTFPHHTQWSKILEAGESARLEFTGGGTIEHVRCYGIYRYTTN